MFRLFLYFFVTIISGTLIRLFLVNYRLRSRVELSLPAILLILGMLFGILANYVESLGQIGRIASLLVHTEAENLIIPAFIMRLIFSFDWLSFLKSMTQVFVLGIFVFFISSVLIGGLISLLLHKNVPLFSAIVVGASLSTTDVEDILDRYLQLKSVRIIIMGEVLLTSTLSCILMDIQRKGIVPKDLYNVPGWLLIVGSWFAAFFFGYAFVRVLRREWFDLNCYIILSFVTSFFLYMYANFYANFAIIPLIIYASMISPGSNHVESELATPVRAVWDALDVGLKMNLAFDGGVRFTRILFRVDEKFTLLLQTVYIYIFTYVLRFLLLVYVYPVLALTGFRMDMPKIIILCLSGLEFTISLTFLCDCGMGDASVIFSIGIVLLSQLVNVLSLRPLISFLGLLIPPRSSEMDDIIRRLAIEKEKAKNTLKQNDLFTDVHWAIVEQVTTFQAVGDYQVMLVVDSQSYGDPSSSLDATRLMELAQLREEAQFMILKSQKMSYERQRAQGLLKPEAYHLLRAEVDSACYQTVPVLNISSLRTHWTLGRFEKFLLGCFTSGSINRSTRLYDEWSGKWFLKSAWWELFVQVTIVIFSILFLFHLLESSATLNSPWMVIVGVHAAVVTLQHFVEVLTAVGKDLWLLWHIIDLIAFSSSVSYLIMAKLGEHPLWWQQLIYGLQLIRVLRLVWIYKVCQRITPTIHIMLKDMVGNRLMLGYDMAKGFIIGQEEALKLLPLVVVNPVILQEMQKKLEEDKLSVFQEIGALQLEWPCLTIKIKAQESAHYILHRMKLRVEEFYNDGLLDEEETKGLLYTINETKYKVTRDISLTVPLSIQDMVRQLEWLEGEQEACETILSKTILLNFEQEATLFQKCEQPSGIFFINYGLVRVLYMPDSATMDQLTINGALPNFDHPTNLNYDQSQEQQKWDGSTFGELGVLTGRPCSSTLICKTPVLVSCIPIEALRPLLPRLQVKMWKMVARKIAALLLYRDNFYGTMPMDDIKSMLTKSLCPDLAGCRKVFLSDLVQVFVLVDGKTVDNENQPYVAPICISKSAEWIAIPPPDDESGVPPVRILIVPDMDEEEDLSFEIRNEEGYVTIKGDEAEYVGRHKLSIVSAVSKSSRRYGRRRDGGLT